MLFSGILNVTFIASSHSVLEVVSFATFQLEPVPDRPGLTAQWRRALDRDNGRCHNAQHLTA
jgi:hypothetical protein